MTIGCCERALSEPDWPEAGTEAAQGPERLEPGRGEMWSAGCGRAAGPALLGLLLVLLVPDGDTSKTSEGLVTCGSVLKLLNTHHRVRLHSHDIKYGSGA